MNGWMARNGLKLTSRGERVTVLAAAALIVTLCGLAFWFETIINTNLGVF